MIAAERTNMTTDEHSAYLARAVAALTPEGRERADELLEQLAQAAGSDDSLVQFAKVRQAEADLGRADLSVPREPGLRLTRRELEALRAGFTQIRDQEPLDDVGDWANAVLALLRDEVARDDPR